MIRTALMILFLVIIGILSIILVPFAYLLGAFDKKAKDTYSFRLVHFFFKVLAWLSGAEITYKGLENLPQDGEAVVYMGNHRGFFDIILFYPVLKSVTGFAAKKEMSTWPLISWWMKLIHCIFINRSSQREGLATIIEGIGLINHGISMMIFPEGTRSTEEGVLLDFKHGSFKLATKPKVKLIPVAYNNTSEVFENHMPFVKKTKVCIEICAPIDTAALSAEEAKELPDTVRNIIYDKIHENAEVVGMKLD